MRIFLVAAAALCVSACAWADKVTMRDGTVYEGVLLPSGPGEYAIDLGNKELIYVSTSEIEKIEFPPHPKNPPAPPSKPSDGPQKASR